MYDFCRITFQRFDTNTTLKCNGNSQEFFEPINWLTFVYYVPNLKDMAYIDHQRRLLH